MISGNDGGATVTFDGGKTWSSIMNQPTAQFYRVVTDNLFPYRIYGGQQDNSTVAIASQSFQGGIGVDDFYAVGGGESAHIAFDPDNPRLVYATTINGTLTEYDRDTRDPAHDHSVSGDGLRQRLTGPEIPGQLECAGGDFAPRSQHRLLWYANSAEEHGSRLPPGPRSVAT